MNNKPIIIGIDAGSISVSLVQMDKNRQIIDSAYTFHNGKVEETLDKLLAKVNLSNLEGIAVTSSTPDIIKGSKSYDSRVSFITAAKYLNKKCGSLLIVGGEKFGLALFDDSGEYLNYRSNSSCAAGTGSFLDQQARRLNLSGIEEFSSISYRNTGEIPKIASRCAVFAKTDLIHAQQDGYSLDEICDGLSMGLAKNICDTLFSNISFSSPVIMAGGVSKNKAVASHISEIIGEEVKIDSHSHLYGAIGAAVSLIDEGEFTLFKGTNSPAELILKKEKGKNFFYDPLVLKSSGYPDFEGLERYEFKSVFFPNATSVEIDIYEKLVSGKTLNVYLGIDIGSTSTKAVLIDTSGKVLAGLYTRTSGRPIQAVQTIFESIDDMTSQKNITLKFLGTGTTGSGRKFIGKITGSDLALDEITAHARAAYELDRDVDTIIEIGGQDAKFTTLRNGMVTFSIMNNVCAAGTGSFIEEQAMKLECPLSEYSKRAEGSRAPLSSDRCTVFMERDLNYYLSEGYSVNEILASVLHSVRENYLQKVAVEANIGERIFFQGATAKNKALVAAFEQKLGKPVMVSKYCHLTGALGVALELKDSGRKESDFRGIEIFKTDIPVKTEICELCGNNCKIRVADINGEKAAFGFLCGRDYETKKFVNINPAGFDLLKERKKNFAFKTDTRYRNDLTVGLPAAVHMVDELPLWKKFFNLLSIKTVSSENYRDGVKTGKELSTAEFCAPITSLYGHVKHLSETCDYIFLPVYLELEEKEIKTKFIKRHYCYYTQFSPSIVTMIKNIDNPERILSPLVRSVQGPAHMKKELHEMVTKICGSSISLKEVSSAYERAWDYYNSCNQKLKEICINESAEDDINVVFVGRPYTLLSESLNKGIPDIFSKSGVRAFYQDMLEYNRDEIEPIKPLLEAVHWHYSAKILEAAQVIASKKGFYPVFVTSFKCSPDSFMIEYFKKILDNHEKPYLILQLDEHDSSTGYETRIEAGIRAFRNHYSTPGKELLRKHISANPDVTDDKGLIKGKTLLLPNWDEYNGRLLEANFRAEGVDARLLEESQDSIRRSLKFNTGQCLPLTAVVQNVIDYVNKYNLNPEKTALWMFDSTISCNIRMYPYFIKRLLQSHDEDMGKIAVYIGDITFLDLSIKMAINSYQAYMFGGMLRKMACKIRPYEITDGETDRIAAKSLDIFYDTFLNKKSKEKAAIEAVDLFSSIKTSMSPKPKIVIFGDLYVRDNRIMNQDLIKTIEENGGEVITTPYNEYMSIIADSYISKWFSEGYYSQAVISKILQKLKNVFEKKYYSQFNRIMGEKPISFSIPAEKILSEMNIKVQNTGESMDNILKIYHLIQQHPDISLFVQLNPSYCCPSLITEAMSEKIEDLTGVPVVTIEYDGVGGQKNEDIIPYLKFPRKKETVRAELKN